jgi:hypothetical protein
MRNLYNQYRYNYEFLKHTGSSGHKVGQDELRLREVIIQNYKKSLLIFTVLALYVNYRRKNKNLIKSLLSKSNFNP